MKRSLLITSIGILCVISLLSTIPLVSAREILYEDVVWISGFDDPISSQWSTSIAGDESDITTSSSSGEALYNLLGEELEWELNAPLNSDTWTAVNNIAYPDLPDDYDVTSEGFYVSHYWGDTYGQRSDQSPSVHFDYNVSMPNNMSDYTITSASVSAVINATVHANNPDFGGIEVPGDAVHQAADYDYIRYYLLISDLPKQKVYEIAYNQTSDLGKDSAGTFDQMEDTLITTVTEENLKFFLTSVLNTDDFNFTITVGIRIFCEDNRNSDQDFFDDIYIKNVSLSFTYQKKMNQLTTASWDGIGNSLNSTNVLIRDASFEFSYKIDTPWPTDASPNSEFRLFVSNKKLYETVKISAATDIYQVANPDGYNVTSLISLDENITVSIQMYIGDNFELDSPIGIYIDNVVLKLTYIVILPDPPPTNLQPYIYSSAGLLAALATGIGLYEGIFKFPAQVRTVKSLRRKIRHGRATKPLQTKDSNTIGRNIFEEEKRLLDKSSRKAPSQPSEKAAPKKDMSGYEDMSPPEEKTIPEKKIEGSK
ncbi:MAG: hypothetical protein JW776_06260 [Candidatus Lokiarchaeota archaeon]|nr:hypothetical protein [Candidatus Lokiarchaeota archaeon]